MHVTTTARTTLLTWLAVLGLALFGLDRLPLSSPPVGDPRQWPSWFSVRSPVDGTFGVLRLLAIALAAYLLAVTALALAAKATDDAQAAWLAFHCTLPSLRPLVFGVVSLSLAAPAGQAFAGPNQPAIPVMVAVASDDPPVMRQSPPPPATAAAPVPAPAPPTTLAADPADPVVTARPGDSLWTLAEGTLAAAWHRQPTDTEIAPYWLAMIDRNRAGLVDKGNPDLIFPDQVFHLPPWPNPPPG